MVVSRTSSSNDGRIFRIRRPSEKRPRTLVNPFMKDIFSSLDLAAKLDRSKKLRVDIGKDEKKGYDGSEAGVGLFCGCRVTSDASIAVTRLFERCRQRGKGENTLEILI